MEGKEFRLAKPLYGYPVPMVRIPPPPPDPRNSMRRRSLQAFRSLPFLPRPIACRRHWLHSRCTHGFERFHRCPLGPTSPRNLLLESVATSSILCPSLTGLTIE